MGKESSWTWREYTGTSASLATLLMFGDWVFNKAAFILWIWGLVRKTLTVSVKLWHVVASLLLLSVAVTTANYLLGDENEEVEIWEYRWDIIFGVGWDWKWEEIRRNGEKHVADLFPPICPECGYDLEVREMRQNPPDSGDSKIAINPGPVTGVAAICENCNTRESWEVDRKELEKRIRKEITRRIRTGEWTEAVSSIPPWSSL